MENRANKVIEQLYKGVEPRQAVYEFLNFELRGMADDLAKQSDIKSLAKKGDFLALVHKLTSVEHKFERKLTQKEVRRIARELIAKAGKFPEGR